MFATLAILQRNCARRQPEWMPTALSHIGRTDKMGSSCRDAGLARAMGGLIGRIIADIAIDRATAEKAGGIILEVGEEEGSEFAAAIPAQFV